jgi:hypothetical protein
MDGRKPSKGPTTARFRGFVRDSHIAVFFDFLKNLIILLLF